MSPPSPLTEADVLAANAAFYVAFAHGDAEAMENMWAREVEVACIHPGWDALRGRARVMASWLAILSGDSGPAITCTGATAHLFGESAFVVCYEVIEGTRLVATNTFVREAGAWRLVHHQAAPIARGGMDEEEDDDDDAPPPTGVLN